MLGLVFCRAWVLCNCAVKYGVRYTGIANIVSLIKHHSVSKYAPVWNY